MIDLEPGRMPDSPLTNDPPDVRFQKQCALWKFRIDVFLNRWAVRCIALSFMSGLFFGVTYSYFFAGASLVFFSIVALSFAASALMDLLPFTRFSLASLFFSFFSAQIPIAMMNAGDSELIFFLGVALLTAWILIVVSRLHEGIVKSRGRKLAKARQSADEAK